MKYTQPKMALSEAIIFNNFAVETLRRGDLSSAVGLLRHALQKARQTTIDDASNPRNQAEMPVAQGAHSFHVTPGQGPSDPWNALMPNVAQYSFAQNVGVPDSALDFYPDCLGFRGDHSTPFTCEASVYLHIHGISIPPQNEAPFSDDHVINTALISGILLYNLGLLNQLQGLHSVGYGNACPQGTNLHPDSLLSRQRRTSIAISLYESSRTILQNVDLDSDKVTGIAILDFLSMVLYNNTGYAAYVLGDDVAAEGSFHCLEVFITAVQSTATQWDQETSALMERYTNDFLLNKMILQAPKIAPSA